MKNQAALIAEDPALLGWLQDSLGPLLELHWIRPGDPADPVEEQVQRLSPLDAAFVQLGVDDSARGPGVIEDLLENQDDLLVVAVGIDHPPPEVVIAAMRAGARDFLVLGRDDQDLAARISRVLRRTSGAGRAQQAPGALINLLGASPDEGLAWAAAHLALAAVEEGAPAERVLLLDAALPGGASLVLLNQTQSYSLLDAVHDVHRCDQTLIDTAFTRHPSGVYLLTLPEDQVGPVVLEADELLGLVDVLLGFFGRIFMTAGANLNLAATAGLVRRAHATVFLAEPTIINSRASKHLIKALRLENCPLERAGLVVDQPQRKGGLTPDSLAQWLEMPLWATLSGQPARRLQAMNAGEPLFMRAPNDAYCADIRQLGQRLRDDNPARVASPVPRKSLLGGLIGS